MIQLERSLQQEIILKMKAVYPEIIVVSVPNSIYFPARSLAERSIIARVVHQMKSTGGISVGAPDLIFANKGLAAFIEIKVPASRDLLGKRRQAGRLSEDQATFRNRCVARDVPYFVAHSWEEVAAAVGEVWG